MDNNVDAVDQSVAVDEGAEQILSTSGMTKRYAGITAVNNLTLGLKTGEIHALIGPNGAGKSTAINLLMGEIEADSGSIVLDGKDISRLSVSQRSRLGMGRTYQITSVIRELTVRENMIIAVLSQSHEKYIGLGNAGKSPQVRQRVDEMLDRFDLARHGSSLAGQLSHGEQGRLEIAMCLAPEPRVLLLDEPMSGMSLVDGEQIVDLLESIRPNMAILLVEHDMDAVFKLASRITVLASGEAIASGLPQDIRKDDAVIKSYLGEA